MDRWFCILRTRPGPERDGHPERFKKWTGKVGKDHTGVGGGLVPEREGVRRVAGVFDYSDFYAERIGSANLLDGDMFTQCYDERGTAGCRA